MNQMNDKALNIAVIIGFIAIFTFLIVTIVY
jgi:hypothetical protein